MTAVYILGWKVDSQTRAVINNAKRRLPAAFTGVRYPGCNPTTSKTSLGSHGEYAGRVTVIAPDRSIRCRVHFNTRVDADAWLPSVFQ